MKWIVSLLAVLVFSAGSPMAQTFTNYTEANDLLNNTVNGLAEDANGDIWMATEGGVTKFDPVNEGWESYTTSSHPGMLDDVITCVEVASSGDIWVGTDFGISIFDGGAWTSFTSADGLGSERINVIKEGPDGKVYVGESNGLSVYDGTTWTAFGRDEGVPFGGITAIDFDVDAGRVWLGTGLSGVLIYDGVEFIPFTEAEGLLSDKVTAVAIAPNGNRWIGTSDGVSVLGTDDQLLLNHTRMYIMPPPDTLNPVEAIAFDSNGASWVGVYVDYLVTVGGVAVNSGFGWADYDETDGLVGPGIRDVLVDGNDNVWVATSTGVTKISGTTTGLEQELLTSFSVYPNPVEDVLNVRLEETSASTRAISVLNVHMQEVIKTTLQGNQDAITLSVGTLSPGVYFVKVGDQMEKVVVK